MSEREALETLDLPRHGTTRRTFRRAYHQKSRQWHPDRNIGNKDAARVEFQRVNAANERLKELHPSWA